jgi:hypothetical protein
VTPLVDPERAVRLARVVLSDVAIYAGDELRLGIEKDDLFDRLAPQLQQAADYYFRRVDASVPDRERIFNHAVVDVLVCRHGRRASGAW